MRLSHTNAKESLWTLSGSSLKEAGLCRTTWNGFRSSSFWKLV